MVTLIGGHILTNIVVIVVPGRVSGVILSVWKRYPRIAIKLVSIFRFCRVSSKFLVDGVITEHGGDEENRDLGTRLHVP